MKRFFSLVLFFVLCVSLCGCSSGKETNVEKYGEWNSFTENMLHSDKFSGSLPTKEMADQYGEDYYYNFGQALLGDPNFVISLTLKFTDTSAFDQQFSVIREKARAIVSDGKTHYCYMNSDDMSSFIASYTDEEIQDGMYYDFEIIAVTESNRISYLSAHIWDYCKDEFLKNFLKQALSAEKSAKRM